MRPCTIQYGGKSWLTHDSAPIIASVPTRQN